MDAAAWVLLATLLVILLSTWVAVTASRLDRLHARCDAAESALNLQLLRRSVALQALADETDPVRVRAPVGEWRAAARDASSLVAQDPTVSGNDVRAAAENRVSRVIASVAPVVAELDGDAVEELSESTERVLLARRFYNDVVRDIRVVRDRRISRWLHLAGHRAMPSFFDIDDTSLSDEIADSARSERITDSASDGTHRLAR